LAVAYFLDNLVYIAIICMNQCIAANDRVDSVHNDIQQKMSDRFGCARPKLTVARKYTSIRLSVV